MSTPHDVRSASGPPAFLRMAAHPVRWRLLGELAASDRKVQELTRLVGQPQNLVSYHLGKLRGERVVAVRRSSADARAVYYSLDLSRVGALLADTGMALHPGVRLVPPPSGKTPAKTGARVLFLCTGNSARSQMAEALLRQRSRASVEVHSAGSHPKPLHRNAVRVMREAYGIDVSGQTSTHLQDLASERFDWVITLCDRVREVCPEFGQQPRTAHWSIADPSASDAGYAAFQQTAAELDTRITFLLAALSEPVRTTRQEHR